MPTLRFPDSILSVDPGGNVGFAQLTGDPEKKRSYNAWVVKLGPWPLKGEGEPPKDEALEFVNDFCRTYGPRGFVICERFITGQRQNRFGRFTNEMIGAVEGITYAHGTPVLMVKNTARRDATPQAYRLLGKVKKGDHDPDDVAAMAHLLAFVTKLQKALESSNTSPERRRPR